MRAWLQNLPTEATIECLNFDKQNADRKRFVDATI
jgi:hypothetical protein